MLLSRINLFILECKNEVGVNQYGNHWSINLFILECKTSVTGNYSNVTLKY